MIPVSKPIIGEEEENAVLQVMKSGMIAQGPKVKEFEERFAEYTGTKYGIAVSSGTTALHTALLAHGIGKGDEVITSPFSFIATSNSILFTGAKPVFVDISEKDFNLNPDLIEEKITEKTKAIMPVHLYGNPCDMVKITKIAKDNDLVIIEDACQAHGAMIGRKKVGSFGTGCFSFYPTKNMTSGEGGMITTDDEKIYEKGRMIREHGSKQRYFHEIIGYNFRMTDLHAAIGIEQLKKLEAFTKKRIENSKILNEGLKKYVTIPKKKEDVRHVFHQYSIQTKYREELIKHLTKKEIGCGIYYPVPIHKQKAYTDLGYKDFMPFSEKISNVVLSLPVNPLLNEDDLKRIVEEIVYFFEKNSVCS
jgi:perosamine synthetase